MAQQQVIDGVWAEGPFGVERLYSPAVTRLRVSLCLHKTTRKKERKKERRQINCCPGTSSLAIAAALLSRLKKEEKEKSMVDNGHKRQVL